MDVKSNDPNWKVELEEKMDWIQLTSNLTANTISLVVKPNETSTPREVKLLANSSNLKKAVKVLVRQNGHKGYGEYTVPLLTKYMKSPATVIGYERTQGNEYNRMQPKGRYSGPEDRYIFFVRNNFAERVYFVGKNDIISKIEDISYDDQLVKSAEFINFLTESGFEKTRSTELSWEGFNKEMSYAVSIVGYPKQGTLVTYERVIEQNKACATWDKFPEDVLFAYLGTPDKFEKVKAEEEAAGSTDFELGKVGNGDHAEEVGFMRCVVAESKRPHLVNAYFFNWRDETPEEDLGTVEEKVIVFNNLELAYWTDEETDKRFLTKEFKALLDKEGWKFQRLSSEGDPFYEKGQKVMLLRTLSLTNINDGKVSLVINTYLQEAQTGSKPSVRIKDRGQDNIWRADRTIKTMK